MASATASASVVSSASPRASVTCRRLNTSRGRRGRCTAGLNTLAPKTWLSETVRSGAPRAPPFGAHWAAKTFCWRMRGMGHRFLVRRSPERNLAGRGASLSRCPNWPGHVAKAHRVVKYSVRAVRPRARLAGLRARRGPLRQDAVPPVRPQRSQATSYYAGTVVEFRRRPAAGEQPRDDPPGFRPGDHALRSGQQLRPALPQRRDQLRADLQRGPEGAPRRDRDLDQGRLRHVAGALRRVGLTQVPAGEPRAEPRADALGLRRHLLLAPLRSRD